MAPFAAVIKSKPIDTFSMNFTFFFSLKRCLKILSFECELGLNGTRFNAFCVERREVQVFLKILGTRFSTPVPLNRSH